MHTKCGQLLRLLTLQGGLVHADSTKICARALHGLQTLHTQIGKRLTLANVLGVKLLAHVAKLRTSAKVLRVALLPKLPNLSASAKSLTILLLAKGG